MNEKITIVIPVYNSDKYLSQCLDSVINQSYKNLEIICVNNNSTDNSFDILNNYANKDNRIKIYNNPINNIGRTRNIGIENATGEYLSFVDSDDYIDKKTIEKAYAKIKEKDSDICIWGFYKVEDMTNKCERTLYGVSLAVIDEPFNIFSLKDDNIFSITHPAPWDKLFKMSFIKKNNIYFPELNIGEDVYFTYLAFITAKKITRIVNGLYYYRIRKESMMHRVYMEPFDFCKSLLLLKEKIIEFGYENHLRHSFEMLTSSSYKECFKNIKETTTDEEYIEIVNKYNIKYKDLLKL